MTRILVTSASGANGDGYGTLLCFSADGELAGPFSDDRRIADPRGLSLSPAGDLVYVTSGDDRVLALDRNGKVILDSGRIDKIRHGLRDQVMRAVVIVGCRSAVVTSGDLLRSFLPGHAG